MDYDDEVEDFFGENDMFGGDEAIEVPDPDDEGKELSKHFKEPKKPSVKRPVNPRAKLNEQSLLRPEGIEGVLKKFANFKPDPKENPYDTLRDCLKRYQHWGHVLAPRVKFEDVVNRVEQLGEKRPVKVTMDKLRLGMPLFDEDFTREKSEDEGDKLIETEFNEPPPKEISPPPFASSAPRGLFSSEWKAPSIPAPSSQPDTPLTEEQRRKIAENRLRALELRAKREQEEREKREKEEREARQAEKEDEHGQETMEDDTALDETDIMSAFN